MLEFCYELPYEELDFTDPETHELYRIGRGEQGVLLVRPYTNDICAHWRFRTPDVAAKSAAKIYSMYLDYKDKKDFVGMDMCRKFLEMGFTRARRYANHHSGKKYDDNGEVRPQESDHWTCDYNQSAQIFKKLRDEAAYDEQYKQLRQHWRRTVEHANSERVAALATTSHVKRKFVSRQRTNVSR